MMASSSVSVNSNIKREEIVIDTTDEDEAPITNRLQFDEDDLQLLSSKHAAKVKYPPGCPVWYDFQPSSKSLDARHGVVKSIYIDLESGDRVIKVSSEAEDNYFRPEHLAFAMNCPVNVKGMAENEPSKELEGVIVCPKPGKGNRKLSYSVIFHEGNGHVRVELGVEADQVSFRKVLEKQKDETNTKDRARVMDLGTTKHDIRVEEKDSSAENKTEDENRRLKPTDVADESTNETTGAHDANKQYTNSNNLNLKDAANQNGRTLGSTRSENGKMSASPYNNSQASSLSSSSRQYIGNVPDSSSLLSASSSPKLHEKNWQQHSAVEHSKGVGPHVRSGVEQFKGDAAVHGKLSTALTRAPCATSEHRPPNERQGHSNSIHNESNGCQQHSQNEMQSYFNSAQDGSNSSDLASTRKRKPPPDANNISTQYYGDGSSTERPEKVSRRSESNKQTAPVPENTPSTQFFGTGGMESPKKTFNTTAICVLTVPIWVLQKGTEDRELFLHLVGENHHRAIGHKSKEISSVTNALINFSNCNSWNNLPMRITIRSKDDSIHPSRDVIKAKKMIEKSLLEFIDDDANSEGRLLYELAKYATGTFHFGQSECHDAVQQYCHNTHRLLWMTLLELPSAEYKGKRTSHGRYLVGYDTPKWLQGNTDCSVEVYGDVDSTPKLCAPYVLVSGNNLDWVNEVSGRVARKIDQHMRGCPQSCRVFFC